MESTNRLDKEYSLRDFESLEALRGEVAIQSHLLKADIADRFHRLEKDWAELRLQMQRMRATTASSAENITAATQLLVESVKDGYEKIKVALAH